MSNTKYSTIGKECDVTNGFAFKSKDYVDSGILNFRVVNILEGGQINLGDVEYLPQDFSKKYAKYLLNKGDILIVMVGATRGKMTMIPRDILPALLNQNMWKVTPGNKELNPKFLYFYLLSSIQEFIERNSETTRGFFKKSDFKNIQIPLWEGSIQKNIAYILSVIQKSIEMQNELIAQTTELKNVLMQKLFTEGTKGERQKETEIGFIPESWDLVTIKSLLLKTSNVEPKKKPNEFFKYIDVSSVSNESFQIEDTSNILGKDAPSRAKKQVQENDIIFATVRPTLKRIAVIPSELDNEVCSTGYCVLRVNPEKIEHNFLFQYLLTENFIKSIGSLQRGASYPAVRDNDVKNQKVPLPNKSEQSSISQSLSAIDKKLILLRSKKNCYMNLFDSILDKLMSNQIRVNMINFQNINNYV